MISGSLSLDGVNWTAPDAVELADLPEQVYVGVASSRGETTDEAGAWPLASVCDLALTSETQFLRGDCNGDRIVNITDAACTLNWLFTGGIAGCVAATNTNGDDAANIADATYLLNHLFAGGPAPAHPFPECGTADLAGLGCETSCR